MKKLLAWLMAVTLTVQLVTPVFAEEIEETQTATEAVEVETEAPTTEIPTTEPTTTDAMETAAPEETSAPTEPQATTEVTEATETTETTASTEETTTAVTEPTEEVLDLFDQDENNEFSTATLALQDAPDSSSEEWLWPVPDNPTIYSPFNLGNDYLINKRGSEHWGIDISRNADLPIVASRTGVVAFVQNTGYNDTSENSNQSASTCRIVLKHDINGKTYYSFYLHIKSGTILYYSDLNGHASGSAISVGDVIPQGTKIGITGNTGMSYGTHLHFGLSTQHSGGWVSNKSYINPNPTNSGSITSNNKRTYSNTDILGYSSSYGAGIHYTISGSSGHTHNYMLGYETAHPHQEYMKCESCGDMYYTHSYKTKTIDGCMQCEIMPEQWGVCGDNLIWKIEGPFGDETMTISGTGDMWDFKYLRHQAGSIDWDHLSYCRIIIDEGATGIGSGAFQFANKISYLKLPSTLIHIDGEAFYNSFSEGTELKLPSGLQSIGNSAFHSCTGLTGDLIIPDSVTSIGSSAFYNCTGFNGKLVLPKNLTRIEDNTFDGTEFTGTLNFPDGLKRIGNGAFEFCSGITGGLTFPETLEAIGDQAFYGCEGLTGTLSFPDGLGSIGQLAFSGDRGLTGILSLPKNLTVLGSYAFCACKGLTGDLILPDGITNIGEKTFFGCTGFTGTLKLPKELQTIGESAFDGCKGFTKLAPLPEKLISICDNAFCNCTGFSGNLVFADNLETIGYCAFYGCSGFTGNLRLPNNLVSVGSVAFSGCKGFTGNLILPDSLRTIGSGAFESDCGITSLTITNSALDWGNYSLSFHSLKSLTMPGELQNSPVNSWQGLETLTLTGSRVKRMSSDVLYGRNAKRIVISEGITEVEQEAFADCYDTEQLSLPKSLKTIETQAFWGCSSLKDVYYNGSKSDWKRISIAPGNENLTGLTGATLHYNSNSNGNESPSSTEIRPVGTTALISGSKLTLTAWAMPDNKKIKANWSLSEDSEAYASISSSGVLTAKNVNEVQNITVIATPTDGSPEARKEIQILPKITIKQAEKFNLFHSYSRAELAITGGKVDCALLDGNKDFVLENENDHFYIRFANPDNPPAKPNTRATLQVFFPGSDTPATKTLTISTTNTAPKLKLNPTSSILNTTLVGGLTVEAEVLGTEDESLKARSVTKGVTASIKSGKLLVTLDTAKTTTATIYLKGNDWAKEVKLTHRITVTEKKPTVKFTAKGKLDVLNPGSEIVYTPKLTNAAGTITDVQLEGTDADLFQADVTDGIIHLKLAKSGEEYSTKKTYKVTPKVTLYDTPIDCSPVSLKVTQSALKLAKIPNQAVYQTQTSPLAVKLAVTSPANAKIGDVRLNAKTTAALRKALDAADGIQAGGGAVTFPASTFASLKPGRYTVILDVFPANAASDTKPIQAKFTLTVQK